MAKTLDQLLDEGRFTSMMKRALKNLFNYAKPCLSYVANISFESPLVETTVLVIGKTYVVDALQAGDNFTNVGYVSDGVAFIATATTPTVWVNGTDVFEIKIEIDLLQNELDENLLVSYDWINNRLLFTVDNQVFKISKIFTNTSGVRISNNVFAIYSFPFNGIKQGVRIDVYN